MRLSFLITGCSSPERSFTEYVWEGFRSLLGQKILDVTRLIRPGIVLNCSTLIINSDPTVTFGAMHCTIVIMQSLAPQVPGQAYIRDGNFSKDD